MAGQGRASIAAAVIAILAGTAEQACAATAQTTFQVTATVVPACAVTALDLEFPDYNPTSAAPTVGSTDVRITCTSGVAYNVGLDAGAGAGAAVGARKMADGAATLTYALYSDGGYATVWGDTIGANTVAGVGSGAQQILTVHGRIGAQQPAPAGSYADTITVTVTF
ncbi:MAG: spore coat U domain-containing protein [Hyphomonadaceae bacterium]